MSSGRVKWEYFIFALAIFAGFYYSDVAVAAIDDPESDEFTRWDSLFRSNGALYGVPWRWLKAICMNESNLGRARSVALGLSDPQSIDASKSSDGKSWGLMQLTLPTARALEGQALTAVYLNDPANSVRLAAKLMKQLIGTFGLDDRESVVRAYNGGPKFGVLTVPYYTKFLANLDVVMQKQPGPETEI